MFCNTYLLYYRFQEKAGRHGGWPSWNKHNTIENLWTLIPLAIVIFLSIYGGIVLKNMVRSPQSANEMEIIVTGQQFSWRFGYPAQNIATSELGLIVNRPVLFKLMATDVIHSFWVPEFRIKQDAVPGMQTTLRITPTKIGSYQLVCNQLCGFGHSFMVAQVKVMSEEDFNKWQGQQRSK